MLANLIKIDMLLKEVKDELAKSDPDFVVVRRLTSDAQRLNHENWVNVHKLD